MRPVWLLLYFYNFSLKPELGVGIDLGMALTPFQSIISDETRFEHTNPLPITTKPDWRPINLAETFRRLFRRLALKLMD